MSESAWQVHPLPVTIGGVVRWFLVLVSDGGKRVYEIAVSQKKGSAQLQAADPAVVPIVVREIGRR